MEASLDTITLQHPLLLQWFQEDVERIEQQLASSTAADIPTLFEDMSLDVFALLLLEPLDSYPNLRTFLPEMPDEDLQRHWTGNAGIQLLTEAARFVEKLNAAYVKHVQRPFGNAVVLDYGSGWGRITRLLAKLVPTTQIYGVDATPQILALNQELGVQGTYELIDEYPSSLPFDRQFDLIYAFSIFTHLSEKAQRCALACWRKHLAPGGLLAVTVRPRHYWTDSQHPLATDLLQSHDKKGFAFVSNERMDADDPYGNTSISREYVKNLWSDWALVGTDVSNYDSLQVILYLQAKRAVS